MGRQKPAKKKGKTKKTMYSSFESEGMYVQMFCVWNNIMKNNIMHAITILMPCIYVHSVCSFLVYLY